MRVPKVNVLVLLAVGTAAHLGARYGFSRTASAAARSRLSAFEVGAALPPLALTPLTLAPAARRAAPAPAAGCRLLVLFSSTCPHCHTAARRDALTPDSLRLPTTWVSHTDDSAAVRFDAELARGAVTRYGGPTAFEQMEVTGVPAAFLVGADDRVRWVGGYVGGPENARLLRGKC